MNERIAGVLVSLTLAALLTAGCSTSSPTCPGCNDEPDYPERTSPANVLAKLEKAYENMDDAAYLDCLADSLVFYLNPDDQTEDPTLPESWDKDEETTIHGHMFGEGTDVQSVTLVMTTDSEQHDEGDPGDPLDDVWTCVKDVDLRVGLPPDLTLHAASQCEFVLEVDAGGTGRDREPLWQITKWYDLPEAGARAPDDSVEDASWGRIKSAFR